jgi:hypothetical protein
MVLVKYPENFAILDRRMKPRLDPAPKLTQRTPFDEVGPALVGLIDLKNPLVRLTDSMQWELFENHWRALHSSVAGLMANSGRRLAGILMLRHMELSRMKG